jgi:hypothetical protein
MTIVTGSLGNIKPLTQRVSAKGHQVTVISSTLKNTSY